MSGLETIGWRLEGEISAPRSGSAYRLRPKAYNLHCPFRNLVVPPGVRPNHKSQIINQEFNGPQRSRRAQREMQPQMNADER